MNYGSESGSSSSEDECDAPPPSAPLISGENEELVKLRATLPHDDPTPPPPPPPSVSHHWRDQGWITCPQCLKSHQVYCDICLLCYTCAVLVRSCSAASEEFRSEFIGPSRGSVKFAAPKRIEDNPDVAQLFLAARTGNLSQLRTILDTRDVQPTIVDSMGNSLMYHAILCGHEHVVAYLFSCGVTLDLATPDGKRLYLAAQRPQVRIEVLKHGHNSAIVRRIHVSAEAGAEDVDPRDVAFAQPAAGRCDKFNYLSADILGEIFLLLGAEELLLVRNVCKRWFALATADFCWRSHFSAVFSTQPWNPPGLNLTAYEAFCMCLRSISAMSTWDAMEWLAANDLHIALETALDLFFACGSRSTRNLLEQQLLKLTHRATPNWLSLLFNTALAHAHRSLQVLLEYGKNADPHSFLSAVATHENYSCGLPETLNPTIFHYCAFHNLLPELEMILREFHHSHVLFDHITLLDFVSNRYWDCARLLVDTAVLNGLRSQQAVLQQTNRLGENILHVAVRLAENARQLTGVLKICENVVGSIDSATHDGYSPLHLAVLVERPWAVELLLQRGANPLKRTSSGFTIQQILAQALQPDLRQAMQRLIAKASPRGSSCSTASTAASRLSPVSTKKHRTKTRHETKLKRRAKGGKEGKEGKEGKVSSSSSRSPVRGSAPPVHHPSPPAAPASAASTSTSTPIPTATPSPRTSARIDKASQRALEKQREHELLHSKQKAKEKRQKKKQDALKAKNAKAKDADAAAGGSSSLGGDGAPSVSAALPTATTTTTTTPAVAALGSPAPTTTPSLPPASASVSPNVPASSSTTSSGAPPPRST